jgi:hypothetical protein
VLSSRRPGNDLGSVHVRVVVDEVALRRGFLRVLWFDPVRVISPVLHNHFHLHVARTRTNGRSLGTFTKEKLFRKLGSIIRIEKYFDLARALKGKDRCF